MLTALSTVVWSVVTLTAISVWVDVS
jgi:hypothetical protein